MHAREPSLPALLFSGVRPGVRLSAPQLRKQVAQLSQRDRDAGCVSYGHKWKTGTGVQHIWTL